MKSSAMINPTVSASTRANFQRVLAEFSGIPLVLASQDSRGVFSYEGKPDIVDFLASIDLNRIPWKSYTYSF